MITNNPHHHNTHTVHRQTRPLLPREIFIFGGGGFIRILDNHIGQPARLLKTVKEADMTTLDTLPVSVTHLDNPRTSTTKTTKRVATTLRTLRAGRRDSLSFLLNSSLLLSIPLVSSLSNRLIVSLEKTNEVHTTNVLLHSQYTVSQQLCSITIMSSQFSGHIGGTITISHIHLKSIYIVDNLINNQPVDVEGRESKDTAGSRQSFRACTRSRRTGDPIDTEGLISNFVVSKRLLLTPI